MPSGNKAYDGNSNVVLGGRVCAVPLYAEKS